MKKGLGKGVIRKLCIQCKSRPVAINYKKANKIYYRSQCDHCSKKRKDGIPLWQKAGYRKKDFCEKCNFSSKFDQQFFVIFLDGDLTNCRFPNLKTVCANCLQILDKEKQRWRSNNIVPDF